MVRLLLPFLLALTAALAQPASFDPFLTTHCIDCHDADTAKGGLNFDALGFDLSNPETMRRWVRVHDLVTAGEMPPKKKKRPDPSASEIFLATLAERLARADRQRASTVLRRLNRTEYEHTVRDLFGIELNVNGLPDDTPTDGFDNVGAGLAVSAEAMQAYLEAADQVLDAVFGPTTAPKKIRHVTSLPEQVDWKGRPQLDSQYGKMFRRTKDGLAIFQSNFCPTSLVNFSRLRAPVGTYRGTIKARAIQSEKPVTMRIYGGDTIVNRKEQHLVGYYDVPPGNEWTTITFEDKLVEAGGTFQPKCYGTRDTRKDADTYPEPGIEIGEIIIEGPLEAWPPPSRAKLLGDIVPASASTSEAATILLRLLPHAFRRPIKKTEVKPYLELVNTALKQERDFEDALRVGLKAVLCSPDFLFLDEPTDPRTKRLPPQALANRLAYFLWSAPPDKTLQNLAANGTIRDPAVLRNEVERMLQDKKAAAFTKQFTSQWLDLREISFTEPDANLFPEFDELLRLSMVEETERFFQEVLDQDLSVQDFIDANFTFLNQRLAAHYGIEGVEGQSFKKVKLPPDSLRGGLLTQASILKVTANGTTTSPVLRGAWILDKLLGQPSPPPPDNVGSVEPDIRGTTTIREQLARHRDNPSCSMCHDKIDPPGFALEAFDPIGGFRTEYRTMAETGRHSGLKQSAHTFSWVRYRIGQPVDTSGHMEDGRPFEDIRAFKKHLLQEPDVIVRNLTQKLLTYATGRRLGFSDRPAVDRIVIRLHSKHDGLRSLIQEIVQSEVFQSP